MTQVEKQRWEQDKAKGYSHFLLSRGLLRAGLPFGLSMVLWEVVVHFFRHRPFPSILELFVKFGFYVLCFGWMMGAHDWQQSQKDYEKPTENEG